MPDPRKIKVLIVEHLDEQRELLANWLTRRVEGLVAEKAATGSAALMKVQEASGNFDIVLMDKELSDIGGIEAMNRIHASYPSLPVVMVTGKDPEAGAAALGEGAYRYILKPLNFSDLEALIRSLAETDLVLDQTAEAITELLEAPVCVIWTLDRFRVCFKVAAWSGEVRVRSTGRRFRSK